MPTIAIIDLHRFYKKTVDEQKAIVKETPDRELGKIITSDFDFLGKHLFIQEGERKGIVCKGQYFSMYFWKN